MTNSRTASHLGIPLEEYDARIVTFLEHYEAMLGEAAAAVASLELANPLLLDLGVGTGALVERCISACGPGSVIGIDSDPTMLEAARARLASNPGVQRLELRNADYLEETLPACDVAVASFAFHHVREAEQKQDLYRRCRGAVGDGGALVLADCYLPASDTLVQSGMRRWLAHLQTTYPLDQAEAYMATWAKEDTYQPLGRELEWIARAGFRPDVVWRSDLFAVLLCPAVRRSTSDERRIGSPGD